MIKDRLRAMRSRIREAQQLRGQLVTLEARMYNPRAQKYTAMPHGSGGDGHSMDDLTIIHIELMDAYRQSLAAIEREQLALEQALTVLSPEQRMVIRYRYFDLLAWEDVCDRIHYSWRQTHYIHSAALKALEAAENNSPEA